jgi:integrase
VERHVRGRKRDAERVLAELITEVEAGSHRQRRRHTVTDLLDRWMAHTEGLGRAPSTLVRYRSAINTNINPRLGKLDVTKVGPAEIDALYGHLLRSGLNPLSVRKSHAILSAAFNQAVKWGWVDRNPVLRTTPPSSRVREIRPPTAGELRLLLDACVQEHADLGSLIYVAATTGARRGELCGLQWNDVDLELATLTVARSVSDAGRVVSVKDTKTHQARRIALDPTTVAVLRDHRRLVEDWAVRALVDLSPSAYVWSQDLDAGTPYRPDRVTGAFRSLRERVGLPHVTFHALRHFAATTLAG